MCPKAHSGDVEKWYGNVSVFFDVEVPAGAGTRGQTEVEKGNQIDGGFCALAHLVFQN